MFKRLSNVVQTIKTDISLNTQKNKRIDSLNINYYYYFFFSFALLIVIFYQWNVFFPFFLIRNNSQSQ
jgi:hypothetical protein